LQSKKQVFQIELWLVQFDENIVSLSFYTFHGFEWHQLFDVIS